METKADSLFAELDRGPAVETEVVSSNSNPEASSHAFADLPPAQVVSRKQKLTVEQQREQTLKTIEADLFLDSMSIVSDSFKFREIEPGQQEPPQEWVDQLEYQNPGRGYELAKQRLRSANAGWMSKRDSPVAVQVAQAIVVGISRSRAQLNAGPKTLNVQLVQMSAPLPQFPELLLESGEK